MAASSVSRCWCPCHVCSVLPWAPPLVSDPVEALAACELCQPLHRGVWKHYKRPRITGVWDDDQADGGGKGTK